MPKLTAFSHMLVLVPFLALTAAGQAPASKWDKLRMLASGTEVRVAAGTAKPVSGALESVTDTTLVILTVGSGPQSFDKTQIASIEVKQPGHRLRNTLIGLGVGAGAGLIGGVAGTSNCSRLSSGGWDSLCHDAIAAVTIAGAVVGTVVGVAWPTGGWRKVYER